MKKLPTTLERISNVVNDLGDIFSIGARVVSDIQHVTRKGSKNTLLVEADERAEVIRQSRHQQSSSDK